MQKSIGIETEYQSMSSYIRYLYHYIKNNKALDIGCGSGACLKTFMKGSISFDISEGNIKMCKKKGLNVIQLDANKERLPFGDENFDGVLCSHILEHVENPIRLLIEIKRVLSKDRIAIIGLPMENSWIRIFLHEDYYSNHPGNIFLFSVKGDKVLLNYAGFVQKALYFDPPECRGRMVGILLDVFQHFPYVLKEKISPAYWWICKKAR